VTDIFTLSDGAVDRYADILTNVAQALTAGDVRLAEEQLEPVVDDVWMGRLAFHAAPGIGAELRTSRAVSERKRAQVLTRDGFICTYCGGRTIPRCILVAISDVFPHFAYDPHYGRGRIHPAFWALAPEVDHVIAHSGGGTSELTNLTTLHTFCNAQKSDSITTDLPTIEPVSEIADWDGLVPHYPYMVDAGNSQGHRHSAARYHSRWLRNFNLQSLGPIVNPSATVQSDASAPLPTVPDRASCQQRS